MAENTKIQWAHHTFNPWRGCTKVSAGCKHCYAEQQAGRNPRSLGVWGANGTRPLAAEAYWKQPIKWDREAAAAGERRRVFCGSLMDIFEANGTMPADAFAAVRAARVRTFDLIRQTPNLDWLLVTKRPENIKNAIEEALIQADGGDPDDRNYFTDRDGEWPKTDLGWWLNEWLGAPVKNVWLIGSIEDQASADRVIPELLTCRNLAPVLGLSVEPLIGPVDIVATCRRMIDAACQRQVIHPPPRPLTDAHAARAWLNLLDWVIVGGESEQAGKCRACDVAWIRSVVQQCKTADVACFVKQLGSAPHDAKENIGSWPADLPGRGFMVFDLEGAERIAPALTSGKGDDPAEWPEDLRVREFPEVRS